MRTSIVLIAVCGTLGCVVPKDQYLAKEKEAQELALKQEALMQKVADLERDLKASMAKARDTERQLTDKEAERRALEEKNAHLSAHNDELSKSKKVLAEAKEALEKRSSEYENLAQSLKNEIDAGKVELSELKGRMTVKMKDKILFASGSSKLGKEGMDALAKVAGALKGVKGRIIRVEGHTDDVPMGGIARANWDLSLARAMAVVQQLLDNGVDPTKLSAAGYGQFQPIVANDSPENRSQNRRIEIVLGAPIGAE